MRHSSSVALGAAALSLSLQLASVHAMVTCPRPGSGPSGALTAGATVTISVTPSDQICTLTRLTTTVNADGSSKTDFAPAGRSYNGREWDAVAGPYKADMKFECSPMNGKTACKVTLPQLDDPTTQSFVLTSYAHTVTPAEEVSRFLEQATFGPTNADMAQFNTDETLDASTEFASWTHDQIVNKPMTAHRPYFRARVNGRATNSEDQMIANADKPCDLHSRWKKYAFGWEEARAWTAWKFNITDIEGSEDWMLISDSSGQPITEVPKRIYGAFLNSGDLFSVCYATERANAPFAIRQPGKTSCNGIASGNPRIQFYVTTPPRVVNFPANAVLQEVDTTESAGSELILADTGNNGNPINDDVCNTFKLRGGDIVHAKSADGLTWYMHDPRIVLQDNSLESPLSDGGGAETLGTRTKCAAVTRNFLNEDSCVMSMEASACSPSGSVSVSLELNEENLRDFHKLSGGRLIYVLNMTEPDVGPCQLGSTSRWIKRDNLSASTACAAANAATGLTMDAGTIEIVKDKIESDWRNSPIKDLSFSISDTSCNADTPAGVFIYAKNDCWEHVHDDENNIYDFTEWSDLHTMLSDNPTAISQFADRGEVYLNFPFFKYSWHPQIRWTQKQDNMEYVGRFGDNLSFDDMPTSLRGQAIADKFGAGGTSSRGIGTMVCGSPGEVSNDPLFGDEFDMGLDDRWDRTGTIQDFEAQKFSVWNTIVLNGKDQLRQRMAWALSQICAMVPGDIDEKDETEPFVAYYDIFVRNAFGNYKDLLKEVAYHPMMAEMLTFLESKSRGYAYEELNLNDVFPDENFAREIMQLFSIGLVKLNLDGTPVIREEDGTVEQTYTNLDIMDNARAWTGFKRQAGRGNIEHFWPWHNRVDPMQILPQWRDPMPKANILGGYIGDGVPMCVDMPAKAYLKAGATYRLLGSKSAPSVQNDPEGWQYSWSLTRMTLEPSTSELYAALCNNGGSGACNFKATVTLDSNLACDASTRECDVDQPRVVQMGGHSSPDVYYEYIRAPCVQFPFYNSALKIKENAETSSAMCGDPRLPHATEACCDTANLEYFVTASRNCAFTGERVIYSTAVDRCAKMGMETCTARSMATGGSDCYGSWGSNCCDPFDSWHWTNVDCEIMVKINPLGEVAIRHNHTDLDTATGFWRGDIENSFKEDTVNFFRVRWRHESFPAVGQSSCRGNCAPDPSDSESCLCRMSVSEVQVFKDIPTAAKAVEMLQIGAVRPDVPGSGCTELQADGDVKAWDCTGANEIDEDTVFEVSRGLYPKVYLKNMHSSVRINNGVFEFRNPPHFMTFNERNLRDAEHETDAVLNQVLEHTNTAPFVALRLIQRFGISNPSPSYIEAVATAFVTGTYESGGKTFGSTGYGDLAASAAAVLLHPEAREPVLDADPSFGSVREPILRVMHLMRSMELKPNLSLFPHIKTISVENKIGQMAHAIPNVFSFFLPENIPPGRINSASLVSPEAGVTNTPNVIGLMGGMFSLIKYGLARCNAGFGPDGSNCGVGVGQLTYEPKVPNDLDAAIEELSLMLTAGRLSPEVKTVIKDAALDGYNFAEQVRIVQQLIVTAPEFHATGGVVKRDQMRIEPPKPVYSGKPAKTIVFYFMGDGMDTYNLLVPDYAACPAMYEKYAAVRGEVALNATELGGPIDARNTQGTCNTFRLHHRGTAIESLYNSGELIMIANMGVLLEDGVTKENWEELHRDTVLFAHDKQQLEAKKVDPFQEVAGTGVLGRMTDALTTMADGFKTGSTSIVGGTPALAGVDGVSPLIKYLNEKGVERFDPQPSTDKVLSSIKKINNSTSYDSHAFGELWSDSAIQALSENEEFFNILNNVTLTAEFDKYKPCSQKLNVAAKLIKQFEVRGIDRDVFYVERGGWDVHGRAKEKTATLLVEMDNGLGSFVEELKAQGRWDSTVVVMLSEFGRTLTPNSGGGTDHGWGGNYFIAGGAVDGGKILGTYPENYDDLDVSRSRLFPTTPNEAMWNGVAEWFGVPSADMDKVLPNRHKFSKLFTEADLFKTV